MAGKILGMNLVTHQTGPEGREVHTLLIEEGLPIDKEFYLGIVLDRATGRPVFMASSAGGMDIEEVAADTPELILKETIDPAVGFRPFQARKLAFGLGLPAQLVNQAAKFMQSLYQAYEQTDASLIEINPFLLTKDGRLFALDAKMNFDDNAMFRHPDFHALRDLNEEEPLEIEASKYDLNYIKLDGNIACMVNGAGLAMATMDIIKLAGRRARQLPRRRRRRLAGARRGGLPHPARRPGGARRAHQHLRRHRPHRHGRARRHRGRQDRSASKCPSSSGSKAPTSKRGAGSSASPG